MARLALRRRDGGFTLVELMCAMAVAGILSSIAYPTYQNVVHKARRAEALVALMQVQMAQERHRADHASYGSLAELGLATTSLSRHYRLVVAQAGATGYEIRAEAAGLQVGDKACRHLRLAAEGGSTVHGSGADDRFANSEALNRTCWGM